MPVTSSLGRTKVSGFLYAYTGYMRALRSLECDKPREWPNSWAATRKRTVPTYRHHGSDCVQSHTVQIINDKVTFAGAKSEVLIVVKMSITSDSSTRGEGVGQSLTTAVKGGGITVYCYTKKVLLAKCVLWFSQHTINTAQYK